MMIPAKSPIHDTHTGPPIQLAIKKVGTIAPEISKEEMITMILAEIIRLDPGYPQRGLANIEKNMRRKPIKDLRDFDYAFYFPDR